jgi:very-short-patch-repair endonuclease
MVENKKKTTEGLSVLQTKDYGNYIVDFYCPKANLIIELDGGQHYSDEGIKKDGKRDAYMVSLGLKVLRFSDRDVFRNLNGIVEKIWEDLNPP